MSDSTSPLFQPVSLGALALKHRVVMAPLTRMRARQPGDVPHGMNATYYGQRASRGGLIVTEATDVSAQARGYPGAPGVYSPDQVAGWRVVTDAVHAKGGLIVLQIWHTGRISRESAEAAITRAAADAVAFGRLFIANPDLPERFRHQASLNRYDRSTFYGGAERGYIDYPALGEAEAA